MVNKRVILTQPNGAKVELKVQSVGFPRNRTGERRADLVETGTGERLWVSDQTDIQIQ